MKTTDIHKFTIDYGFGTPKTYNLYLTAEKYQSNDTLAVIAYEPATGDCITPEMFDVITVNLPFGEADETHAYIDTNNCPWAPELLKEMGVAKPTRKYGHSGFCKYPLYKFNLEMFK